MIPMCEAPAPSTSSSATPAAVPAPVHVVSADVALDRPQDQYLIVRRDTAMAFLEQQLVAFQSQSGKRFVFTCCLPVDCVHTLGWFFADPSARAPPDDIHDAETVPDDYANAIVESTAVFQEQSAAGALRDAHVNCFSIISTSPSKSVRPMRGTLSRGDVGISLHRILRYDMHEQPPHLVISATPATFEPK